jgi:hypothetical protein
MPEDAFLPSAPLFTLPLGKGRGKGFSLKKDYSSEHLALPFNATDSYVFFTSSVAAATISELYFRQGWGARRLGMLSADERSVLRARMRKNLEQECAKAIRIL